MPTIIQGQVIPTSTINTWIQMLAKDGAASGVPPNIGAAPYYLQGGLTTGTTDANGNVIKIFPTPFPNGNLMSIAWPYINAGTANWICNIGAGFNTNLTKTQLAFTLWNANTNVAVINTFISFFWAAVGF